MDPDSARPPPHRAKILAAVSHSGMAGLSRLRKSAARDFTHMACTRRIAWQTPAMRCRWTPVTGGMLPIAARRSSAAALSARAGTGAPGATGGRRAGAGTCAGRSTRLSRAKSRRSARSECSCTLEAVLGRLLPGKLLLAEHLLLHSLHLSAVAGLQIPSHLLLRQLLPPVSCQLIGNHRLRVSVFLVKLVATWIPGLQRIDCRSGVSIHLLRISHGLENDYGDALARSLRDTNHLVVFDDLDDATSIITLAPRDGCSIRCFPFTLITLPRRCRRGRTCVRSGNTFIGNHSTMPSKGHDPHD